MNRNRRRFLQSLGLGSAAALLPVSKLLRSRAAAAGPECPPRVVFFYTHHGPPRRHWKMTPPGLGSGDSSTDLIDLSRDQFSLVADPLYPVREHINILDGLSMMSCMAAVAESPQGNNHGVSWGTLATNAEGNYDDPFVGGEGNIHPRATTASIDQHIARSTAPPGMLPSVVWGESSGRFGSQFGFSSGPDGSWIAPEDSPSRAFDRLVENGLRERDPTEPPVTPPTPDREDLIAARRARVLGLAASDYERILPTLDTTDRMRLMRHMAGIRDLETRWTVDDGTTPTPTPVSCDPSFDAGGDTMDAFFRLTALALSCDVTRVVSLNCRQLASAEFGGPPAEDVHESFAHGTDDNAILQMGNYYRYHAAQFASLVQYLAEIPEGGGSLLDSTLVIWVPELSNGQHEFFDTWTCVAGGSATGIQTGRYTRFAQDRTHVCDRYGCDDAPMRGLGRSHLWISAMQHMGMSDTSFNRESVTDLAGRTVDLTGPLELLHT